jgi:hypothetical protein
MKIITSMKFIKYLLMSIVLCSTHFVSGQGIDWQSIHQGTDLNYQSVTSGNGIYVAIASSGVGKRVATSPDGATWTIRSTPVDNFWQSVTFGNGLFVAVSQSGTNNRVMTSPDGINWTSRISAANNAWQSVTYGNGLFVAVASSGSGNRVMTSPDGITWTARAAAVDNNWYSVTYGNNLFVAVARNGIGNRVMTSPDGITWTSRTSAADNLWNSVTYGNGIFVAVSVSGTANGVMTSTDGISWTVRTAAANNQWYSVTYGNGLFVAVSSSSGGTSVMTSPNGINWTTRTPAADNNWYSVTFSNGLFVAVANNGVGNRIMTSTDGITWTSITGAPSISWNSITYGNGLFVAVADSNSNKAVMTSPDGITWTPRNPAVNRSWLAVTYGNGLFVAVGGDGGFGNRVMTSPDGITWTSRTSAADNLWQSVTYGNGLYVAVSSDGTGNRVMTSPDGINWTSRTSAADNDWYSVTYGNGLFVAVSRNGIGNRVMTSPDGITWTSRTSAADNQWNSVTYGNGLFVAVGGTGAGNNAMTSTDGITWTLRTAAGDQNWYSVTYGNGLYVAVAVSGTFDKRIMTSSDGINWNLRTSPGLNAWLSVAYGENKFVAVSIITNNNQVMISTCTQVAGPSALGQSFCSSTNPTVANLVATGQDIKWYATETSPTVLSSSNALSSGTYYATQTVGNCESPRTAVVVTVANCAATWTGAVNNSWSTAGNWSNNLVPDGNLDIEVPSGNPILDVAYTVPTTKSVTVSGTGTLTIAPTASVSVEGILAFNDRPVTLKSDATGTAVLGQVTGLVTGATNVTVERYIPQGKRAFRFLSPGVTTTNFISNNWQLGTHITGSTTGANGFDATETGSASLFTYNNNQTTGSGWSTVTSTNATNLQAGQGYRLLVRGDRNVNINTNSAPTMNAPVTLSATGTLTTGTVIFDSASTSALNATNNLVTNGYSLVGNPYVNTVNWNALTKVGLTDSYYVWDPNMGTASQRGRYVVYNTLSGSSNNASGVNQYIQPGQAFFVQNSTLGVPGSLTFQEINKVGAANLTPVFRMQQNPMARLNLSIYETSELNAGGFPIDAIVALFDSSFSAAIDNADVAKLSTGTENLSIANNSKTWAIEARGPVSNKDEVIMNLEDFQANKNYSFRTQFSNFDPAVSPFLVDTFLGTITPLGTTVATDISFVTTASASSYKNDRFKITFQNKTLSDDNFISEQIVLYPNPVTNNQFNLTLPAMMQGPLHVQLINVNGQLVYQLETEAKPMLNVALNKVLPQGVYFVKISNKGITLTKKITIK